ncbi:NmrA family transcriptional regulator [Lentibacillus kapialis]|uniref:NmrA family transcriptional regulator n=1 Tax=Lentibacillus kapialis TaxID=340214 RepID=A0A917Q3F7_9BACI|nr:SDR family oxidoreductase [Lentibacillus kapialis]GGK09556.1 NmrA family transcriptional regulator [Lentibacillus kapialis]
MNILVTGFTGKVGLQVANYLKDQDIPIVCAVRDVEKTKAKFGDAYEYVNLNFSDSSTFDGALENVDRVFLMYPPGEKLQFDTFLKKAKDKEIKHITYLSLKDVQYMPFIHHYKMEKLIKNSQIPYTFVRAGYFMQNLNDFLCKEIKERQRIFVPAGKGKTSFVDTRDLAEISGVSLVNKDKHKNKIYVITGNEALNFFDVAKQMTEVLGVKIEYTNPSVKEFKNYMRKIGEDEGFVNVVVGIHIPTKLGLAKGVKHDYEKLTGKKPTNIKNYIKDYKKNWI